MRFSFLLPLLLTGGVGLAPAAEDAHFGIQGALSIPSADLSDNANLGVQFGGHGRWNYGQGHGLMGRVDLTYYGDKYDISTSSLGAAADYTFHFDRRPRGLYVLAGLSLDGYSRNTPTGKLNDNGLGLDLGVGYDVDRHLGLQARVTRFAFDQATMTALNLGVTYTF